MVHGSKCHKTHCLTAGMSLIDMGLERGSKVTVATSLQVVKNT